LPPCGCTPFTFIPRMSFSTRTLAYRVVFFFFFFYESPTRTRISLQGDAHAVEWEPVLAPALGFLTNSDKEAHVQKLRSYQILYTINHHKLGRCDVKDIHTHPRIDALIDTDHSQVQLFNQLSITVDYLF
jgi:hypothetical protein